MAFRSSLLVLFLLSLIAFPLLSNGEISEGLAKKIKSINARGAHYGLVVSGEAELNVFLAVGVFQPVDISGRRFHVGMFRGSRTILVMSGSGSVNAAQTTQLLLTHFRVKGVIHYGRAASANPKYLRVGDVAIPSQFAHTAVWYWQKFRRDEGSFDHQIANLTFSDFNVDKNVLNFLQSVYLQPETVYSKPEEGDSIFWFNADDNLYATAEKIEDVELDRCLFKSLICLPKQPKIKRIERASSADIYLNNEAYRNFLHKELNVGSIDTETAAIAMVCESEKAAFLAMRSITNYAGGPSLENDVSVIKKLWTSHASVAVGAIFDKLAPGDSTLRLVNSK
ncbi:bark storage protein A isoform X1 [Cryptomeria japonica]|uniref:bark storage protein A isoform X1 n=1 Tax=Cryptomeria japonica TaxID=3369 RepID=UPI0027DA0990|nr:bark storage protein A isoform X1 [Cryptomeria japonica]